ncbi:hypothetical protein [Microcoleus phage My-WqHQDG]|nr:hypothetical protein [Microcoleus phage My-WqHQDG]
MSTPIDPNVYQPRHTTLTKITSVPLTANKAGFRLALNADGTDFIWVAPDTNQVPEGGNNLYFTTARARAAINGAASTVLTANLPLSRVLISNSTGKIVSSAITSTELGYLAGVTTPLQPQLTALTTTINNLAAFPRTLATITGAVSNITTINLPASKVLVSDTSGKVVAGNVTTAEVEYLSGVTANVQTQLWVLNNRIGTLDTTSVVEGSNQYFTPDRAVAAITGAASTIATADLSPGKALVSDANGKVKVSDVSMGELGHLSGATSNLQTQLLILNNRVDDLDVVDTSSIEEGTNLYFTPARAVAAITGGASTIASTNLTPSKVLASNTEGKVVPSAVTTTELGYLAGVTSPIQTQINNISTTVGASTTTSITEGTNLYFTNARAVASITGGASTISSANLTASKALASDGTGKVVTSTTTAVELGYLAGVTSNVQTQISNVSTSIGALTTTSITEGTNQYFTSARVVSAITGAASTIATTNLSISRALVSDGTGKVFASAVTTTELGYLIGTTSAIQTQINTLSGRTITVGSGMTGGGNLSSNISLGLSFDASTSNIKMAGAVSLGTLNTVPRADHVHPSDTSKVNVSLLGVASGVATLDSASKVPVAQIPTTTTTVGFGGAAITSPSTISTGLTIPVPITQGGTGSTDMASALSAIGGQPINIILSAISNTSGDGLLCRNAVGQALTRTIETLAPLVVTNPTGATGNPILSLTVGAGVGSIYKAADGTLYPRQIGVTAPLTITNSDGVSGNPTIALSMGPGSALNADLLDGLNSTSFLRSDASGTLTGNLSVSGNLTLNGIQMSTAAKPGPSRLFRREFDSPYSVQTTYDGTRWVLEGFGNGTLAGIDTYHAPCRVDSADKLTGLAVSSFLRSDVSSTLSATLNMSSTASMAWSGGLSQKINLLSTSYGIGVQNNTLYVRAGGQFSIYQGGVHSDTVNDGGTGGYQMLSVTRSADNIVISTQAPSTANGSFNLSFDKGVTNKFIFRGDGHAWCAQYGWTPNWSDARLKTNISKLGGSQCLDMITNLSPVIYDWDELHRTVGGDFGRDTTHYGFIAQEVDKVIPHIVQEGPPLPEVEGALLTLDMKELIPMLVGAIQCLNDKVDTLENQLRSLSFS